MSGADKTMLIARLAVLTGAALVSVGAWQAWHPAGLIAPGVMLLIVGVGALR